MCNGECVGGVRVAYGVVAPGELVRILPDTPLDTWPYDAEGRVLEGVTDGDLLETVAY